MFPILIELISAGQSTKHSRCSIQHRSSVYQRGWKADVCLSLFVLPLVYGDVILYSALLIALILYVLVKSSVVLELTFSVGYAKPLPIGQRKSQQ